MATSLQFGAIATAHWTVLAFWYASIFTGFASIYLGSVEAHAMSLNRIEKVLRVFETRTGVLWRGICVFSLGLAHTFLGMCIILYLAGLVVFLLEPLRAGWGREQKVCFERGTRWVGMYYADSLFFSRRESRESRLELRVDSLSSCRNICGLDLWSTNCFQPYIEAA